MWCIPRVTAQFERKMLDVLSQYEEPYNPREPRINVDEKTTQLLGTPRGSKPPSPGKPRRTDYEYERNGTANVFVCVEPRAGERHLRVTERRTARDFALFMGFLVLRVYAEAEKVHVTIDNLNTHTNKAILETYGEEKGRRICDRIVWHYTPEHASWLNAAEIEISVLSRSALAKRIPNREELRREVRAYQERRNRAKATIDWRFTRAKAREKFHLRQN